RNRGIEENALGHSVCENACGDDGTGALPSYQSVKQELLNVSLRIPHYTAPAVNGGVCQQLVEFNDVN
ncbi:MAG: hypothetical protein F6K47_27485, partial [Symploca sp. SIO2E6]|nr:hypothetical protein [Symploca sp. SIO2E6]